MDTYEATRPHAPDHVSWRQSKWLAIAELLLVVLIAIGASHHLLPLGRGPWLFVLAWASLLVRKIGWRGIGFALYRNWRTTLALGVTIGVLLECFELFISQPLLEHILRTRPNLNEFQSLAGNFKVTLLYLALVWVVAAFGEEMIYRGYLMNRVADLFNRTPWAWVISLIVVHIGFGLAHSYQGLIGVLDEGLMGVLLGIVYLRCGRNLAVPIIVHGIQDSIDLLLIFLHKYPGM